MGPGGGRTSCRGHEDPRHDDQWLGKRGTRLQEPQNDGLSVIAVGGDKLSRGLTLEGLSISYFLRTSRMYDTLMQMGRWFGYRPGYLDLCRLFTTSQLVNWYRHIALAEVELKREFDRMADTDRIPLEYGLRVRTHPDGMIVTALNKMCHTQTLNLSWSGVLVQTTHLPKDSERIQANFGATERLVEELGPATDGPRNNKVWVNVPAATVADYLEELRLPAESARAGGAQVAKFIRRQSTKAPPELSGMDGGDHLQQARNAAKHRKPSDRVDYADASDDGDLEGRVPAEECEHYQSGRPVTRSGVRAVLKGRGGCGVLFGGDRRRCA